MQDLTKFLSHLPVIYVTRDLERALGLPPTPGYSIITNATPFAKQAAKTRNDIILIESPELLDTRDLLALPKVKEEIEKHPNPSVLVFKNTPQIEEICFHFNWKLLNPPAELANAVEEKISQLEWLGSLQKYLPNHALTIAKNIAWQDKLFIAQFNRAHTGTGTTLIKNAQELKLLQSKFPNRDVRVTDYIVGPAITSNNVVWEKETLVGNINYQITGLAPFTTNPFATIGNDWALPKSFLSSEQISFYKKMVSEIGKKLWYSGWKGLFGVDAIVEEKTGKIYLIEINARQPASTTYESELQSMKTREHENTRTVTTFEAHLASVLEVPYSGEQIATVENGAQVIVRVPDEGKRGKEKGKSLGNAGFNVIEYDNSKPGTDWLRIQSTNAIMKAHNEFNEVGEKIKNSIL